MKESFRWSSKRFNFDFWSFGGFVCVTSRQNPTGLLVAPDANGQASGSLFWDDGESFETEVSGIYNEYRYSFSQVTQLF